ncbi:hypothetical protein [Thermodesulfovibrio hydrogeniphilus]
MDIARDFISEAILSFYEIASPACRQARNDPFLCHYEQSEGLRSNLKNEIASSLTLLAMTIFFVIASMYVYFFVIASLTEGEAWQSRLPTKREKKRLPQDFVLCNDKK